MTPPLTPARLEEILALAARATPGEWTARLHVGIPDAHIRAEIHGCNLCDVIEGTESSLGRVTHEDMQANARHIAACNPPAVTAIITRLLAAEAELIALRGTAVETLEYVRDCFMDSLESGRNRIVELGGSCDSVEAMAAGNPGLRKLRAILTQIEDSRK